MNGDWTAVVAALLGGGGILTLTTALRAWADMRSGSRASTRADTREVVKDLQAWRDDLEEKIRDVSRDCDYWRDLAAQRGWQVRELGAEPADPAPVPPSERRRRNRER